MESWLRRLGPNRSFSIQSDRMLKKANGAAGTIPLLAQCAVADSPRWTRAVGIIPPTPYEDDEDLYPCRQPWTGERSQSVEWTLNPFTEVVYVDPPKHCSAAEAFSLIAIVLAVRGEGDD